MTRPDCRRSRAGRRRNVYQAKIHSFSGCSSLYATGSATKDGNTYVVRNLDWGEAFCDFSTYVVVFNPTDGSNSVANVIWPGWTFALTALNSKGVDVDMHDGTSMGGQVLAAERPSFEHRVFDFLADGDSTSAVGSRFLSTRVEFPSIWGIADPSGDMCSFETTLYDSRRLPDGEIDAAKMREIFELPLFNEDGSFREGGGPTKPKKQDADITNYTIAADLENLQLWVRLPPSDGEWQHVDLKALFA